MELSKKQKLRRGGWKVGTAQDFLELTDAEAEFIEIKLALAQTLKQRRTARNLTQGELARALGSSQSRVAKMEAADASVSLELLVRALLTLELGRSEVGRIIGRKQTMPAT